jgi:hypothetical protein
VIIEDRFRVGSQGNFRPDALCFLGGAAMSAEDGPTGGPELANGHLGRKYQDVLKLRLQVRQAEARMFQPGDPIRLSKLGE